MLGELCNIYVDSHTCNYILNLFFSFCLGLTVKQVSEARRLCINATVINGVDGEFQKQGYYATTRLREGGGWRVSERRRLRDNVTVRRGRMGRFRSQETYATMRQCQGGGWGASEARMICDNATARRGWIESFRKKETTRWGDSAVRRLMRQRDSAKGVDGEFQKQRYNTTA